LIRAQGIGTGAEIEIIRSGEVIPKLEGVLRPSDRVFIPDMCPVCGTRLTWQNDFLRCENTDCRAQIEQRISHWFKTLGNADWFGIKSIARMVENGFNSLEKIYAMQENDFAAIGFGPVQSRNLAQATKQSMTKPVEEWRFLAAFGISNLGKGDSRKLLSHMAFSDILKATAGDIACISGFGEVTGKAIEKGVSDLRGTILHMLSLGFNLVTLPDSRNLGKPSGVLAGKGIVFTGKMVRGSRETMQAEARGLGARVQTAVSGKTDFLVCGQKTGAAKISKAEKLGVAILTEMEYLDMLAK